MDSAVVVLVVVVAGGVAVYLVVSSSNASAERRRAEAEAARKAAEAAKARAAAPTSSVPSIGDTLLGGFNQLVSGAAGGIGAGIGQGVASLFEGEAIKDKDSTVREAGRKLNAVARKSLSSLGIGSDPGKRTEAHRRARKIPAQNLAFRQRAENHAAKVHAELSRSDVESWSIVAPSGVVEIHYRGQAEPFYLSPPGELSIAGTDMRMAVAVEGVVRATGRVQLSGRGPLSGPFSYLDQAAFSDNNYYAPATEREAFLRAAQESPEVVAARAENLGRRLEGSTVQRGLNALAGGSA